MVAVPDITTETVVNEFFNKIFWRYGSVLQLISDNGSNFTSKAFKETMKELRIDHIRTSTYNPAGNGRNERCHRTLNQIISKLVHGNPMDWDLVLNQALAGIRFNPSESTNQSPFFLLYGRDPILPVDTLLGKRLPYYGDEFHKQMLERNHKIFTQAYTTLRKTRARRDKHANKNAQKVEFKVNDPVYYKNFYRNTKFDLKWIPYFRVVEIISPKTLMIKNQLDNQLIKCHVDQVRLCPLGDWDLPSDDDINPRPIRNCRYVVQNDNTTDSECSQAGYQTGQLRVKKLRTRRQRDESRFSETLSEDNIPLATLQSRLRKAQFDRLHSDHSSQLMSDCSHTDNHDN
jgi:hypothetical protein